MRNVILAFGALAPSIKEQLQSLEVPIPSRVEDFEDCSIAITRLYIKGLLTQAESDKARTRLVKMIRDAVKEAKP